MGVYRAGPAMNLLLAAAFVFSAAVAYTGAMSLYGTIFGQ
jgi:hypothetical protein